MIVHLFSELACLHRESLKVFFRHLTFGFCDWEEMFHDMVGDFFDLSFNFRLRLEVFSWSCAIVLFVVLLSWRSHALLWNIPTDCVVFCLCRISKMETFSSSPGLDANDLSWIWFFHLRGLVGSNRHLPQNEFQMWEHPPSPSSIGGFRWTQEQKQWTKLVPTDVPLVLWCSHHPPSKKWWKPAMCDDSAGRT